MRLAISDAHLSLKAAIAQALGYPWQRCTVHFLRDCLDHARHDQQSMLAVLIRPIAGADDAAGARDRLSAAVGALEGKLDKVAAMLEQAEEDVLAFYSFPADHSRKLRSTNLLERLNREIGPRADVVDILPDDRSLSGSPRCSSSSRATSGSSRAAAKLRPPEVDQAPSSWSSERPLLGPRLRFQPSTGRPSCYSSGSATNGQFGQALRTAARVR